MIARVNTKQFSCAKFSCKIIFLCKINLCILEIMHVLFNPQKTAKNIAWVARMSIFPREGIVRCFGCKIIYNNLSPLNAN